MMVSNNEEDEVMVTKVKSPPKLRQEPTLTDEVMSSDSKGELKKEMEMQKKLVNREVKKLKVLMDRKEEKDRRRHKKRKKMESDLVDSLNYLEKIRKKEKKKEKSKERARDSQDSQ